MTTTPYNKSITNEDVRYYTGGGRIVKFFSFLLVKNAHFNTPETLCGTILYQIIWNIIYALYRMNLLDHLTTEQLALHLEHAEELVCYGDGFEMLYW